MGIVEMRYLTMTSLLLPVRQPVLGNVHGPRLRLYGDLRVAVALQPLVDSAPIVMRNFSESKATGANNPQ
jgi:hypothetical protein